jgi:hypothetical protein
LALLNSGFLWICNNSGLALIRTYCH